MSYVRTPFTWEWQYLDLLRDALYGTRQRNRTGIDTFMVPGAIIKVNLQEGFPAVTTKKLAFEAVKGELLGFLRGYTSAADFRKLGCKIWDQNANENEAWLKNPARTGEDDLGYIYSRLWTDMPHTDQIGRFHGTDSSGKDVYGTGVRWNQIEKLIEAIVKDPTSRRLIVSAWHPEVFNYAALPPCHVLFQVLIDQQGHKMHMSMYQRSCDLFLGVPFNIASYALLTHILAQATGYNVGTLTWFGADCHIYENHKEQVIEQLGRDPYSPPVLVTSDRIRGMQMDYAGICTLEPSDFKLVDYKHHEPIKAPMAV